MPRAIALAMIGITLLYIALQVSAQGILGPALPDAATPLADAAGFAFGGAGRLLLLAGAAVSMVFALMDAVYISLWLAWCVKEETFRRLRWPISIAAALVWFGIWSWAIGNFWETVYSYVFPPWAQTWVPWIAFVAAGIVALGLWTLSLRIKWMPVLVYCLLGGLLGSLTHIWAIYRGMVTKPPMLQGASPLGAVAFAFFEYIFYWCVILTLALILDWIRKKLKRRPQ